MGAMTETFPPAGLLELLERLHAAPTRMVLEFTGAGSLALAWLHGVGGSSRTILEASDRYAPAALIDTIGLEPEAFTSRQVAFALARKARERASFLSEPGFPVVGVGASSTIATDRAKRGEHRSFVALNGPLGCNAFELVMEKGARTRQREEELVSRIILTAVADGMGVLDRPELALLPTEKLVEEFEPAASFRAFADGREPAALIDRLGQAVPAPLGTPLVLLSGSFNPVHHGHLGLASAIAEMTGTEVTFELPLVNADKPGLNLLNAQRRAAQFAGRAPVLLSRAPLFVEKARLFPGSSFVVGADTAVRILDPRFYPEGLPAALQELDSLGVTFLVAGRTRPEGFTTLADLQIPPGYGHMFRHVDFRQDVSSTELRQRNGQL